MKYYKLTIEVSQRILTNYLESKENIELKNPEHTGFEANLERITRKEFREATRENKAVARKGCGPTMYC